MHINFYLNVIFNSTYCTLYSIVNFLLFLMLLNLTKFNTVFFVQYTGTMYLIHDLFSTVLLTYNFIICDPVLFFDHAFEWRINLTKSFWSYIVSFTSILIKNINTNWTKCTNIIILLKPVYFGASVNKVLLHGFSECEQNCTRRFRRVWTKLY